MRSKSKTSFSPILCSDNDFRYSSCSYHIERVVGWFPCFSCLAFFSICFALLNITCLSETQLFWYSTGILLNDKARDWSKIAIHLLQCRNTPRILQISPATAVNDPDYGKSIAIKTLMFCRILAKFKDLCVDLCVVHVDEKLLWFLAELVDFLLLIMFF